MIHRCVHGLCCCCCCCCYCCDCWCTSIRAWAAELMCRALPWNQQWCHSGCGPLSRQELNAQCGHIVVKVQGLPQRHREARLRCVRCSGWCRSRFRCPSGRSVVCLGGRRIFLVRSLQKSILASTFAFSVLLAAGSLMWVELTHCFVRLCGRVLASRFQSLTWRAFFCAMISTYVLDIFLSGINPGWWWWWCCATGCTV